MAIRSPKASPPQWGGGPLAVVGLPPSRRFDGPNHLDKAARPRGGRAPQFWFGRQTAKNPRPDMGHYFSVDGSV